MQPQLARRLCCAVFALFALSGEAALAREGEHWPVLTWRKWNAPEPDGKTTGEMMPLTPGDRFRLADMRMRSMSVDSGNASLALLAGRARSRKVLENTPLPFDRYAIKEASVAAHADLAPGLSLYATGHYAIMKRRLELHWSNGRRLTTNMSSAGVALGNEESRIGLDYVAVTPSSRSANARMGELMGGAPLAGKGVQLSLSGKAGFAAQGNLHWAISGASFSRRASDAAFLGQRLDGTDQRLTVSVQGTF